ncbi:acetyl esterase/lipase [Salibacterium salarium]|uniref:alpha/beta hydrolase n=1 Tax=Salibacterium salarium TaxID=284579 RepID=UPI002783D841|nr:alpha/beta hydrolase [Salibacterium salarium]MDQ0299305.1 acetyl esterase/lipase [Salibacterium salarium]
MTDNQIIKLWEGSFPFAMEEEGEVIPSFTTYVIHSTQPTPAVIVCPGGGYTHRAEHEGEPVAQWLNTIGISAFVLNYRVHPYKHPAPLMDLQRAIRYVRRHAKEWNINGEKIGILGFSAGGHLAATAGTYFDEGNIKAADSIEKESSRPDAIALCYPVISFKEHRHQGSMEHLLGDDKDKELQHSLSLETQVSEKTPPTFIWHTADDEAVPVENSLLFASALSKMNVPFECHTFESGRHGLGLVANDSDVSIWTELCENWFKKHFFN